MAIWQIRKILVAHTHVATRSCFRSFSLFVLSICHIYIYICAYTHIRAPLFVIMSYLFFFLLFTIVHSIYRMVRGKEIAVDFQLTESQRMTNYRRLPPRGFLSFPFFSFLHRQEKKNNPIESTYARFAKHLAKLQLYIKLLREHREKESNRDDIWLII